MTFYFQRERMSEYTHRGVIHTVPSLVRSFHICVVMTMVRTVTRVYNYTIQLIQDWLALSGNEMEKTTVKHRQKKKKVPITI